MTMFQVDLDKLRNYLWYWYEKRWCWGWECKCIPESFNLPKIWATSLKIRVKMAPKVCRKTHEDLFGGHTKKVLMIFVGGNV